MLRLLKRLNRALLEILPARISQDMHGTFSTILLHVKKVTVPKVPVVSSEYRVEMLLVAKPIQVPHQLNLSTLII